MSNVQVKPLTRDEKHIGVVISTDSEGNETRLSAKRWDRKFDGLPSDWITISIYLGDSRWQERELRVEDALRFAEIIQHKAGALIPAPAVPEDVTEIVADLRESSFATAYDCAKYADIIEALAAEVARLRWQPMDTAPTDGTNVLLAVERGPFVHVIQGAFYSGKWMDAADRGGEYLCWRPNCLIPDEYLPWTDAFKDRAALNPTGD